MRMLFKWDWNGYTITYRKGTFDEWILHEIFEMNIYDVYKDYMKDPKTIIDLGAHIGAFTLKVAYDNPEAKIWSWEIYHENANLLQLNIENNKLTDRVKYYGYGVGKCAMLRYLDVSWINTGGNTLQELTKKNKKSHRVPNLAVVGTFDLESIINLTGCNEIDLVKCDIERAELEVFPTISIDTLRRIKVIVAEFHVRPNDEEDAKIYDKMFQKIHDAGFEIISNDNMVFICVRKNLMK